MTTRPSPIPPVVDQTRWTRDDAEAGRCSGLQINTLTVSEHQVLPSHPPSIGRAAGGP